MPTFLYGFPPTSSGRRRGPRSSSAALAFAVVAAWMLSLAGSASADTSVFTSPSCDVGVATCTDVFNSGAVFGEDHYVGHDEPALGFYSNTPGSGNSAQFTITLPSNPQARPTQDGTGGTWNFQLYPTFWFGMVLCDSQSYPEYTTSCTPDSDANIFENSDPNATDYLGHHPGSAFLELQFYPPGWVTDCAQNTSPPVNWCANMHLNSLDAGLASTGSLGGIVPNNNDCLNQYGVETTNEAFLTHNGVALDAARTLVNFTKIGPPVFNISKVLVMHSGDRLRVTLHDTPDGVATIINDLTTGQTGSMTASPANGFQQVDFQPDAGTCATARYAFHPMYSTSSELTRATWGAGLVNTSFSTELGHFEYCQAADPQTGLCTQGVSDPAGADRDDFPCAVPPFTGHLAAAPADIGGCTGTDVDFDGVSYQPVWPGTNPNPRSDAKLHASPITFGAPLANGTIPYERVGFETDTPLVEAAFDGPCDPNTGTGCTDPPAGANFYPIYSTGTSQGHCVWHFGGPSIPGTTNTFGGTASSEYGPLTAVTFATPPTGTVSQYDIFHRTTANPC